MSTELLTFVKGAKGKSQIVLQNYNFVKHRECNKWTSEWKCRYYDRGVCKSRLKVINDNVIMNYRHTHPPLFDPFLKREIVEQKIINLNIGSFTTYSYLKNKHQQIQIFK